MKRLFLLSIILFSLYDAAFADKSALTPYEKATLYGIKGAGALSGYLAGKYMVQKAKELLPEETDEDKQNKEQLMKAEAGVGGLAGAFMADPLVEKTGIHPIFASLITGGIGSHLGASGATAAVGYHLGNKAAIAALAKYHGVSYRVEYISQYYDLNISQYRSLFMAAEQGQISLLTQEIDRLFPERFGSDWKIRLKRAFKRYGRRATQLLHEKKRLLKDDQQDFVRMVRIGAALQNLVTKKFPAKKDISLSAEQFYQDLDFI